MITINGKCLGSTNHFMIIFKAGNDHEEVKIEVLGWLVDPGQIKKFIKREFPQYQSGYSVYVISDGYWALLGTDETRSRKHFEW